MANLLIDSHFHTTLLNSSDLGIDAGIDIGTRFNDLPGRFERLKNKKNIYLSAAMGPWECGKSTTKEESDVEEYGFRTQEEIDKDFEILKDNIYRYNPLFIGECGLDFFWEYGTREMQVNLFEKHFELANSLNKAIIIHNRESDEKTKELIIKHKPIKGGIIHCFSGNRDLMKTALDYGFFISFAGNLTFKKNEELRNVLKEVPSDRLLLETDSPYLTPVPFRGQPNTPDKVLYTYKCAAETLGICIEDLKAEITENFNTLIKR